LCRFAARTCLVTMGASSSSHDYSLVSTFTAPTNIALIKYWGKRDLEKNTPINSSISLTLNQGDLCTTTTVVLRHDFAADKLWLNGKEKVDFLTSRQFKRHRALLALVRARATSRYVGQGEGRHLVPAEELRKCRVHIVSVNNFPTGAGMASSAAGLAALTLALADVYGVHDAFPGELTTFARQGSGSATRSLAGGLVEWKMGAALDGHDSIGVQAFSEAHWPELCLVVAVVSDKEKKVSSAEGMTRGLGTSDLLRHRASVSVPRRLEALRAAYAAKDFPTLARLTMEDSNSFHATCQDTYPPVAYMDDASRWIVDMVHKLNGELDGEGGSASASAKASASKAASGIIAAYTFDAGPNAHIITTRKHLKLVLAALLAHFPAAKQAPAAASVGGGGSGGAAAAGSAPGPLIVGCAALEELGEDASTRAATLLAGAQELCATLPPVQGRERYEGRLAKVFVTSVGGSPIKLPATAAIASATSGEPLALVPM
jgi:diphosphomevalonate decarboxylase